MAALLHGESSQNGVSNGRSSWYFSRREIEEHSPSRIDGIELKKETYLRKSYCTFLQDLGMRLKVPQVTIATAIIFCHRFFIRQSHAKNDRRTIATVCMFLAGKVEETPRLLKDVILVSYDIINKKNPAAAQRIKQKEVYEQQKELILFGERVVLTTLAFDFNVHHPYKPLVEAIKKFKVAQNALAQVAWNFVNDGLRTSLCLQFRPHHIAAGAIFLAAKFLKVKLPSDAERVWWQEFHVTPRQLEEVSNQMLELYEQNRVPASQPQGSEVDGSAGGGTTHKAPTKGPAVNEELASKQTPSQSHNHSSADNHGVSSRNAQNQGNDNGSGEMGSVINDHKVDVDPKDNQHPERLSHKGEGQERANGRDESAEAGEWRDDGATRKTTNLIGRNLDSGEGPVSQSPKEVPKIDKDKVKAALEKRRKLRKTMKKKDVMDEDDLIEKELEDGIEMAVENEKIKKDQNGEVTDGDCFVSKGQSSRGSEANGAEEGEMVVDDVSPVTSRKRKSESPPERQSEGKRRHEYGSNDKHDSIEDDRHKVNRGGYADKEHRRHTNEIHL